MPEPRPCPICRRPIPAPREPGQRRASFCSERCRQVDLGRWFTGGYAIPATEADEDENPRG
ncbi:DNA gyrase inhibitor YacG [Roseococcus microcysteis]|uniref:DNA gyrase inhibitor YacG n=1 Tax=Roseococcus microcysteis TaxID=2771361 RepID=UPI00168B1BE4|nr:DNA gyrase inhibitor YacG [Roseococcus microcysteis]